MGRYGFIVRLHFAWIEKAASVPHGENGDSFDLDLGDDSMSRGDRLTDLGTPDFRYHASSVILRFRFLPALASATLLLAGEPRALSPTEPPSTASSPRPPGRGRPDASSLVLDNFPSYLEQVETIRGLTFTRPVAKGRQSLADFRAFLAREIEREMPARAPRAPRERSHGSVCFPRVRPLQGL